MKANEKSAHGVRGYFLMMPDGTFVFRVYTSVDRKEWKDYQIRHHDIEVEIVDNYSSFYEEPCVDENGITQCDGYLDYPSRLTEKFTTGNPGV